MLYHEEVGLYYMRNRWYDPEVGRFLSEDPIGLQGGINLYQFGAGDPINNFDPLGLQVCFRGSWDDVNSLHGILERATRTSLTVGGGKCTVGFSTVGNSRGFEEIQKALRALIYDNDTYWIQYSNRSSYSYRDIKVDRNQSDFGYSALFRGQCTSNYAISNAEQALVHELAHAYYIGFLGQRSTFDRMSSSSYRKQQESQAMIWENIYNTANGRKGRCAY